MKHAKEAGLRASLRKVLAASHVAAVTIAVLLFWAVAGVLQAVWAPLSRILSFLFTVIAILDIPYFSKTFTLADRTTVMISSEYLYNATVSFFAAWLLARWVYGMGPLRCLATYRARIIRRKRA